MLRVPARGGAAAMHDDGRDPERDETNVGCPSWVLWLLAVWLFIVCIVLVLRRGWTFPEF
jgi:hypothetical protein